MVTNSYSGTLCPPI